MFNMNVFVHREESKAILEELRVTREEEREAERKKLEAKKKQDIERLKVEIDEELSRERERLESNKEEKLNSLRHEVNMSSVVYNYLKITLITLKTVDIKSLWKKYHFPFSQERKN